MFAGNFAPAGWMFCSGQQLPISENETLFQLIGTTYGGDGQETFNLPNLSSRVPMHMGNQYTLAESGGVESVTLTVQQLPTHTHPFTATQIIGNQANPAGNQNGNTSGFSMYIQDSPSVPFSNQAVTPLGGSQPHNNLQPYLAISFIISLFGIFPSPT
jgi:microcystin-dependent protein